jgi:hypothetical protein
MLFYDELAVMIANGVLERSLVDWIQSQIAEQLPELHLLTRDELPLNPSEKTPASSVFTDQHHYRVQPELWMHHDGEVGKTIYDIYRCLGYYRNQKPW